MHVTRNPLICALDTTDMRRARALCSEIGETAGAVKLGLEFFAAHGPAGVQAVAADCGMPVFLDLKFHDIPNTVARAIRAIAGIDAFMLTVHAAGGEAMLRAAVEASREAAAMTGKPRPLIVGVTVLTSLDRDDLVATGIRHDMQQQVLRLAEMAQKSGLDGVVCSPQEIALLRERCGREFVLVVPGIRPAGSGSNDQKRVLTPRQATENGADYIVVGRPITEAASPGEMARQILASL